MQLDNTRIAVRERGTFEILDVAGRVCRDYAAPLLVLAALGAAPFLAINMYLTIWMVDLDPVDYHGEEMVLRRMRHIWWMSVLVFLQAPTAMSLATVYLGKAVFHQRPKWRDIFGDVLHRAGPLAWCHLGLRGVAPAVLLLLTVERQVDDFNPGVEIFLIGAIVAMAALQRAVRPFITEIILLEKNPWRSSNPQTITIGRRSAALHNPSSGDSVAKWLLSGFVALILVYVFYAGAPRFTTGVLLADWWHGVFPGVFMTNVCFPLAMWFVAAYFCVVRFLSYLDLRIRQEGWEVELGLRAEAVRRTQSSSLEIHPEKYPEKHHVKPHAQGALS